MHVIQGMKFKTMTLMLIGCAALSFAVLPPDARKQIDEAARKSATEVVQGKVVAIYSFREEQKGNQMGYDRYIAEIVVSATDKGKSFAKGDRAYVKYFRKIPPPGWVGPGYSQFKMPKVGDTVKVHLKGDKQSGFSVVSNGFDFPAPAK